MWKNEMLDELGLLEPEVKSEAKALDVATPRLDCHTKTLLRGCILHAKMSIIPAEMKLHFRARIRLAKNIAKRRFNLLKSQVMKELNRPVEYSWWLVGIQGIFFIGAWGLLQIGLAPSIAAVLLGGVAIVMAVRSDERWSRTERIIWIIIAIVLMVAEIRNINRTEREQANTLSRISQDLDATKVGLQATQKGIEQAAEKIEETATGIGILYSEMTGGDSYMYLDITFIGGPLGMDAGVLKKGMMVGGTSPKFVGKYPLHNVYLSEFGPLGQRNEIDYGTIFPDEIGRPRAYPQIYFYPDNQKQLFHFFITTSNGSYGEVVLIKKIGDKWLWACRFAKVGQKKPIRVWGAPGFPKELLSADWDKLE